MSTYSTGTVSQSGTTVTGVGTTFTTAMVGGCLIYSNGLDCMITGFGSATSLTVNISQTISSQNYTISYNQFVVDGNGNASLGTVHTSKFFTTTNTFVDPTDNTKTINFSSSGATTGTTTTFTTASTVNRVLTLPNTTDTLVSLNAPQTISGITLTNSDTSSLSNSGQTLTLPTSTDTLIGRTTTDTLTNKTITGTTNTVDANNLRFGSTWVTSLGGSAPTTNQILTYNGTNPTWQNIPAQITYFTKSPSTYTTGTASQSGTTITGSGTTFTSAMVGGEIVFSGGQQGFITAFGTTTSLTVTTSQTVSSTTYTIYYGGLQTDNSSRTSLNNVYNAQLLNNAVFQVDATDNTKQIKFQTSGATTGTTLTLAGTQTANRVTTFPDVTDTISSLTGTQTLTNKTATSSTNNITSTGLFTATNTVNVSGATAPSNGQVLMATSATGANWQPISNSSGKSGFYGNGSDGTVTISSNTTLTRDMYYQDLTVNTGIVLGSGGYRIFVLGTLTLSGTANINNNGNAGAGQTGGTSLTAGTLGIGTGGGSSTSGGAGSAGTNMTNLTRMGGLGGAGGTGSGGSGGAAGTGTVPATTSGGTQIFSAPVYALTGVNILGTQMNGGTGGGAGGGGNGSNRGGGGGCGGGVLIVCAYTIAGSGTISANGANGVAAPGSNAGGGGGGGGGSLVVMYNTSAISNSNFTANGGTGGALSGSGTNGTAGGAGNVFIIVSG